MKAESRIAKAVTPMKFWFMGEIVTDGVGQMRTYGPRGQGGGGPPSLLTSRTREELWRVERLRWGLMILAEFGKGYLIKKDSSEFSGILR